MKRHFFCPSDVVSTKTTIPLRVSEEQRIYTSTLCIYSPPLRGIVVYYSPRMPLVGIMIIWQDNKNSPNLINTHSEDNLDKKTSQGVVPLNHKFIASPTIPPHKISKGQGNNNLLTHPYKCKIVLRNMKSSLCYGVI